MKFNLDSKSKKRIILTGLCLAIVTLFVAIALFSIQQNKTNKTIANPELARAMEYGELTEKDEETQSEYVRFSVYFARDLNGDGYAEKVKGTCKEVEGEDTLYMSLNVLGNGYLENGKITIKSDNMYFKTALVNDETINGNYISENTKEINLKQVNVGTQKLIFGQVRSGDYRYISTKRDAIGKDTNKYSGTNKIILTGTHVAEDGTRTDIEKEIEIPVDWYSSTKAEIPYTYGLNNEKNKYQNYNTEAIVDSKNQEVNLEFKIVAQESNNKLLLQKSNIEGTIPELNGYKATKVEITGENVKYTYDEETGEFTAYREAQIGEDGVVTKEAYTSSFNNARYSEFKLKVTYPLAAYNEAVGTIVLNIPVEATFEGYNNPNEEFDNPYVSNVAEDVISITYERGGGDVFTYDVKVGQYVSYPYDVYVVSKKNVVDWYNNEDYKYEDRYEVNWSLSRGNSGSVSNIILNEPEENYGDAFLKTDGTYENMESYSESIAIYFTNAGAMLGENGWIKLYNNDTDELIHEFTAEEYETYTKEKPYYYKAPVRHIRIETSKADKSSSFKITQIKQINDEKLSTDKTREEFNNLNKIYSYLSGKVKYEASDDYKTYATDIAFANYDEPVSIARITSVTPNTVSTQETTNVKITIGTDNLGYNVKEWQNGTFLVKFPEEIILAEVNDVRIDNGNVSVLGYDIYEENGNYYLKILTENNSPETYTITIDSELTPDPRKLSANKSLELYAYNENGNNYKDNYRANDIYDINSDGNTKDTVNYDTEAITFVGPTSLITTEIASDYNEAGDEISTIIAPQVALVDKLQENKTAKINVHIINNYSGNISGVVVVGKTPFEGNTSQILGKDLGSTFTAEMTGPIEVPEKLKEIAKVYYSENEVVNNDINDASNNWKTADEVTDFSKIRTYAIDLGDYVISKGEEYICTYEVNIPEDVNYNDVTYSTHAVYFYLETDEGRLKDQTETSKLGFMIAKKFNLEIVKNQKGNNFFVEGATYKITEEGQNTSKIARTNAQGKLTIKDLYVERTYEIEEIRSPEGYALNENKIKFKTTVDESGNIQVEKLEGETKTDFTVNNQTISVTVEDEPLSTLNILKQDTEGQVLENIRFEITGKGYTNRAMITNSKGIATISGLYPNEEYTIKEARADGYYVPNGELKFVIEQAGENYNLRVTEDTLNVLELTSGRTNENLPSFQIKLQNEKIPTYNFEILKSDKDTEEPLANAQFKLKSLDSEEEEYYTTNNSGIIDISGLYQYVEGKNILGEYELTEVVAPEGYITDTNTYKFRCKRVDGNLTLEFLTENSFEYTVENGTIKVNFKNAPIFKLYKKDGDTQEPLPNTKFAIYKIDEEYNEYEAYDVRGDLVGEQEEINGKTYQVITTDENGEISLNLPQGLYKVVEVQALEDYDLPEAIEDRTYYFGIDATVTGTKEWTIEKDKNVKLNYFSKFDTTKNGEFIACKTTSRYNAETDQYINSLGITRIDKKGNLIWNKTVYGESSISIKDVKYKAEDSIIIAISTASQELYLQDENGENKFLVNTGIENTNQASVIVLKFDGQGNYIDSVTLKGYLYGEVDVTEINKEGNFVVSLEFDSDNVEVSGQHTVSGENEVIEGDGTNNSRDVAIFYFDDNLKVVWSYGLEIYANNWCGGLSIDDNGDVIFGGTYWYAYTFPAEDTEAGEELKITPNGAYDLMFLRFNKEGKIQYANSIGGTERDYASYINRIEGDGYIATGYSAGSITIPAEDTVKQEEIVLNKSATDSYRGIIIKYTEDNKVEWAFDLGEAYNFTSCEEYNNQYLVTAVRYSYDEFEIPGNMTEDGQPIKIEDGTSGLLLFVNKDGKIIRVVGSSEYSFSSVKNIENELYASYSYQLLKIYQKEILPSVPDMQQITVDNYKKQYSIWTYVNGEGGTISGQNQPPYEQVNIHENSKKDIVITPAEGYEIYSITINGEKISYESREDGTVILDKFTNMTEDKEVVVSFIPEEYLFTINKVNEDGEKLPGAEFELTTPITDDPSIGENAIGELIQVGGDYYEFEQEGNAYKPTNLNVNNSVAMSGIMIDLSSAKDWYKITINAEMNAGNNNSDNAVAFVQGMSNHEQQWIFDLTGKQEARDYSLIVHGGEMYGLTLGYANYDGNTNDYFVINSIKVEQCEYTQTVTTDSNGEIKLTLPNGDYVIKETKAPEGYVLNEEEIPFTVGGENNSLDIVNKEASKVIVHHYKDGTTKKLADDELFTGNIGYYYTTTPKEIEGYEVVTEKIPNNASGKYTEQPQEVIYYYKEIPAKLIVNYYIEGTTEVVPGTESEQRKEITEKGENYETSPAINADPKYELVAVPGNSSGIIEGTETVVTYYYRVKDSAGVIVHHIDIETKEKIAPDVVIPASGTAKYGDEYKTEVSNEIPENYEYVSKTDNWEGTMIDTLTEVTYEYRLIESTLTNSIEKTATEKINNIRDEITYNITYTANISNYIGMAQITIVDTLPYAIDISKSTLNGGTYNSETKTIIWKELIEGIDTYRNPESGNIQINKNIEVVYTNIDTKQKAIENTVKGQIKTYKPEQTSVEVIDTAITSTGFTVNIPVSKVWEDNSDKLGQRPTRVLFKLTGSDESEYIKELAKPGTTGSTTTQDSTNPNKWNDIFENLPKYDSDRNEIQYTLTELNGELTYYDASLDSTGRIVTNTNKYGKVTVHYYIMNPDGSLTTTRVPDAQGQYVQDAIIEGKEGDTYTTEEATTVSEKYELVEEKLPANAEGIIEKYNEEKPQEVIYYYRLKPAKVLINYLEKDEDTDDSNNVVLSNQEQITGYVDDSYNTDIDHRKETIEKDGKTYTLVSDSGNKTGNMTLQDITVTYYYLQNTKATVRYVERNPETHEIVKDLEEPYTQEGLVGDEFVTNEKAFIGYKLVESPEKTTIEMTKEEQTLIYYYEPVYTGLIENHIDDKTGKVLYTETHDVQVGENYNIPSKEFEGYDLVEEKLPENAEGTMGEELVTVNYYYIKKAVLEVNYIDKLTGEPLTEQIVDETKHEGDEYTTEQKTFDNYDLVEVPSNANATMVVETDEEGNITNNRTVVTYYYAKKSAGVEEHHIDIRTGEELEKPTLHEGHIGDEYNIPSKNFLSYVVATTDKDGNNVLPENAKGMMTEEKIVVNYYYNQPAKVIVHYVEKATGKEIEEINPETGELQQALVVIEGFNQDEYETTAKEFEYYTLIESPEEPNGTMKVEIVKDEEGNDIVNNTIELYYYYEAKPFNIGVEKEITGIAVNGERRTPTNGKLEKVEIYRKSTESTSVQVEYKIKVSNTGEVSGNATIEENIPEGMSLANNDGTWEEQEGKLIKVIPEIGAGETKEYIVLLNWEQTGENMGEKANEVKLVETGNVPGFVDNNDKDNTSNANVIISVETGELPIGLILALVALVGLETITLRYAVVLTKRQKKNK